MKKPPRGRMPRRAYNSKSDVEYIRRWYGVAIDCEICKDEAEKELEELNG